MLFSTLSPFSGFLAVKCSWRGLLSVSEIPRIWRIYAEIPVLVCLGKITPGDMAADAEMVALGPVRMPL